MSTAGTSTTETCTKRTSDECAPKVKRICKRNSPRVEMKWFQEYKKEVSVREERKIALAKEQHEENKKMMADILNLMKKEDRK